MCSKDGRKPRNRRSALALRGFSGVQTTTQLVAGGGNTPDILGSFLGVRRTHLRRDAVCVPPRMSAPDTRETSQDVRCVSSSCHWLFRRLDPRKAPNHQIGSVVSDLWLVLKPLSEDRDGSSVQKEIPTATFIFAYGLDTHMVLHPHAHEFDYLVRVSKRVE